jgi:hypothetical protein
VAVILAGALLLGLTGVPVRGLGTSAPSLVPLRGDGTSWLVEAVIDDRAHGRFLLDTGSSYCRRSEPARGAPGSGGETGHSSRRVEPAPRLSSPRPPSSALLAGSRGGIRVPTLEGDRAPTAGPYRRRARLLETRERWSLMSSIRVRRQLRKAAAE